MRAPRMTSFCNIMRGTRAPLSQTVHGQGPTHLWTGPASETGLHLRSAREWVMRLAPCPRVGRCRRRSPVRTSCRPDMHLGRPLVSPVSVLRPPFKGRNPVSAWCPMSSRTIRTPPPRLEDNRNAPLTGARWRDDSSPIANVKNKIRTSSEYFSENQKMPIASGFFTTACLVLGRLRRPVPTARQPASA